MDNIKADSIPDLDEWGYDSFWMCSDWVKWHQLNRLKSGKKYADAIFKKYWDMQTIGAHGLDCRTTSPTFRKYIQEQKLEEIVWGDSIFRTILAPAGVATDVTGGTGITRNQMIVGGSVLGLLGLYVITR